MTRCRSVSPVTSLWPLLQALACWSRHRSSAFQGSTGLLTSLQCLYADRPFHQPLSRLMTMSFAVSTSWLRVAGCVRVLRHGASRIQVVCLLPSPLAVRPVWFHWMGSSRCTHQRVLLFEVLCPIYHLFARAGQVIARGDRRALAAASGAPVAGGQGRGQSVRPPRHFPALCGIPCCCSTHAGQLRSPCRRPAAPPVAARRLRVVVRACSRPWCSGGGMARDEIVAAPAPSPRYACLDRQVLPLPLTNFSSRRSES